MGGALDRFLDDPYDRRPQVRVFGSRENVAEVSTRIRRWIHDRRRGAREKSKGIKHDPCPATLRSVRTSREMRLTLGDEGNVPSVIREHLLSYYHNAGATMAKADLAAVVKVK
jgi:hypothetical protein